MPKIPHIILTDSVRETLIAVTKSNKSKAKTIRRALILLELDKGKSYDEVAKTLQLTDETVSVLAQKYRKILEENNGQPTSEQQYSVLYDKARSGRPPRITGEEQAKITALACSAPPEGYSQWSLRLLSDKAVELEYCDTISHTSVGNILKKTSYNLIASDIGALP
jgi:transposase